ncbi:hypothetical protein WPS_29320 [Vulcanimicrobium alpinum]|uniref:Uncharacterized protein n=1 Tax=Vulcanimicrobium alpinum TaxID=3016050 RepID=A0AAN1XZJ7_UNVUL|nr:hypothetical protein [Vulcanimicrobium alpinum]BDE07656.1 hypothetical protein WPS_29320 [Vulcanimicrobium alpinum]
MTPSLVIAKFLPLVLVVIAGGITIEAFSLDVHAGTPQGLPRAPAVRPMPSKLKDDWAQTLPMKSGETQATIEAVSVGRGAERTVLGADRTVLLSAGDPSPLSVKGWAIDAPANAPAGGVLVRVDDGRPIVARYGLSRPDVAAALGNPALEATGYKALLETAHLAKGAHRLRFYVLDAHRTGVYLIPDHPTRVRLVRQ